MLMKFRRDVSPVSGDMSPGAAIFGRHVARRCLSVVKMSPEMGDMSPSMDDMSPSLISIGRRMNYR